MGHTNIIAKRAYHAAYNKRRREKLWRLELIPRNRPWNKLDMAWAAGLFEGEGCFSSHTYRNSKSYVARINMTDKDIVDRFASILDIGTRSIKNPSQPHHLVQYVWMTGGFEGFQATIAALWSWLGARRKQKARELLLLAREWFAGSDRRGYPRRFRRPKKRPTQ